MCRRASWATWSWVKMYWLTGRSTLWTLMEPSPVDGLIQTVKSPPQPLRKNLQLGQSSTWGPYNLTASLGTPFSSSMNGQRYFFRDILAPTHLIPVLALPHDSRDKTIVSLLFFFYNRVRFGLMVWIWDDTGQPGALNRLFTSLDPCSAPPCPTTSQCWSWRGPQHTYGFSSWTGLSLMPLRKSLNRVYWVL